MKCRGGRGGAACARRPGDGARGAGRLPRVWSVRVYIWRVNNHSVLKHKGFECRGGCGGAACAWGPGYGARGAGRAAAAAARAAGGGGRVRAARISGWEAGPHRGRGAGRLAGCRDGRPAQAGTTTCSCDVTLSYLLFFVYCPLFTLLLIKVLGASLTSYRAC